MHIFTTIFLFPFAISVSVHDDQHHQPEMALYKGHQELTLVLCETTPRLWEVYAKASLGVLAP